MLDNVARPALRQKRSKLAPTSCQASETIAAGTMAVDVVNIFMALLSFRGFDTPNLMAQGEQRLPPIFNIQRDNALAEHTPHCNAAERSELLTQELGKGVAGNHPPSFSPGSAV
jgi:hypothetical protein